YTASVDNYSGLLGLDKHFANDSQLELSVSDFSSRTRAPLYFSVGLPAPFVLTSDLAAKSTTSSVDAQFTGSVSVAVVPSGIVHYAVGAQFRRESLTEEEHLTSSYFSPSRHITAEFLELRVPLLPALEMSLADRNEHYSDFGSTNNPKVGLIVRVGTDA